MGGRERLVGLPWLLLTAGPHTAAAVLRALLGRRRAFVILGDVLATPRATSPEPVRPGPVVFAPEIAARWPIWKGSAETGAVSRERLPLPEDLKQRIEDWAARWDAAMDEHLYEWPDEALRDRFDAEARQLCAQVAAALGPDWRVEYGGVDP